MPEPSTENVTTRTQALCGLCMGSFDYESGSEGEASRGAIHVCPACERATAETMRRTGAGEPPSGFRAEPTDQAVAADAATSSIPAEDEKDWCTSRIWWVRLLLWTYLSYTLVRYFIGGETYRSLFDAINLGIHELGHYLFSYCGQLLHVAGGSIAQCMAPILSGVMFLRQRDYFAVAVSLFWLGTNLAYVSVYMADARALSLPMVAPGMGVLPPGDGGVLHDWNHLFGITGMIPYDTAIAALVRIVAVGFMVAGLTLGARLILHRMRPQAR